MTDFSKTLAAVLIAAAIVPVAAKAAAPSSTDTLLSNVYVAAQAGYNNPTHDALKNAAVFSGSVGYRFTPNFRLEGEIAYRKNDEKVATPGDSIEDKFTNYMINGWYDFANSSAFTPYIGGGIGLATLTSDYNLPSSGSLGKEHDEAFAYQLGGGVAYSLTGQLALTADYRFLDTSNFSDSDADYKAHEIRAGIRYNF